jgi:hypothetical protein
VTRQAHRAAPISAVPARQRRAPPALAMPTAGYRTSAAPRTAPSQAWPRCRRLPSARAVAAAAEGQRRPDGGRRRRRAARVVRAGGQGPPARPMTGATGPRAMERDQRRRARRSEAADRGRCCQAACSPNSPPIPHVYTHHSHCHHIQFCLSAPALSGVPSASCWPPIEFQSGIGQATAHIRGEYGQRWEPRRLSSRRDDAPARHPLWN